MRSSLFFVVVSSLRFDAVRQVDSWCIITTYQTKEWSSDAAAFICCCCKSNRSDVRISTAGQFTYLGGSYWQCECQQKKKALKGVLFPKKSPVDSSSQIVPRTVWSKNAYYLLLVQCDVCYGNISPFSN